MSKSYSKRRNNIQRGTYDKEKIKTCSYVTLMLKYGVCVPSKGIKNVCVAPRVWKNMNIYSNSLKIGLD